MNIDTFTKFIRERHAVYERRAAGQPWPWTSDPILQQYRFCNVYRNLDAQSVLIQQWLTGHEDDWFAMAAARLVNWWPSLEAVGLPLPWNPSKFVKVINARKAAGEKTFTGAYMVRAGVVGSKAAYLAQHVLQPMWQARKAIRPQAGDTLDDFHVRLMQYRDMGSFMAAQVVADAKYGLGPLAQAPDWWTWAASGPGSRRGLNRLLGKPLDTPWKESGWRAAFAELLTATSSSLADMPRISGQDLQNCLCELDKHQRVLLGQGRPRSKYLPPVTTKVPV